IQNVIIRTPRALSDPVFLSKFEKVTFEDNKLAFKLLDDSGEFSALLNIVPSEYGIQIRIKVASPEPVWIVEWKLSGFILDELILPALGGQSLTPDMPEGTVMSFKYPFWWNAQFVFGMNELSGLMVNANDANPELRLFRVAKENNRFSLSYGAEAKAPLESRTLEAEISLSGFNGGWEKGVDLYRRWMEKSFNPVNFRDHYGFPAWADNINFILELWGARKGFTSGHSFSQMTERLNEWKKYHSPENTLVYLAGFAENGIDSHAPDYNPSKQCGGEEEFKKFMEAAHGMGYKIMLHTNVLAMTFNHRDYDDFKKYQVIDPFGREQGWGMDMDGDWLAEPYFAYINPGYSEWGDYMEKVLGKLIEQFQADAIFLDQTLLAFNASKGPNFLTGMRDHITRLQMRFPGVLFAGEGLHEQNVKALPFAQIHGIDSITEVHGMDGQMPWRKAHPVYTYLFGKYTKFVGHLLTKHPSHPLFAFQESAYAELGVIPVLSLYNSEQKMDIPEVHKMIERAKNLTNIKEIRK
ncbi:MAG TPA: DUF6259 domain-containing protein, partial [Ignavibacteriaceae bacterium]